MCQLYGRNVLKRHWFADMRFADMLIALPLIIALPLLIALPLTSHLNVTRCGSILFSRHKFAAGRFNMLAVRRWALRHVWGARMFVLQGNCCQPVWCVFGSAGSLRETLPLRCHSDHRNLACTKSVTN